MFDVITVGQTIVPQDVAIVPEFLDELGGLFGHVRFERVYVEAATTNEARISREAMTKAPVNRPTPASTLRA